MLTTGFICFRRASTVWRGAWWSFSAGKLASVKIGLGCWSHLRNLLGCGQTLIISHSMIPTSHPTKKTTIHWLVISRNTISVIISTRVIPKVSGLDILDNNIFYNLCISETYILYEL